MNIQEMQKAIGVNTTPFLSYGEYSIIVRPGKLNVILPLASYTVHEYIVGGDDND